MRKAIALLALALLMPCGAMAAVSVSINSPGVSVQIGSQDNRGYYWDGYDWREPQWWHSHQGKHRGERNNHGQYWNGSRWDAKPPAVHHKSAPAHRSGRNAAGHAGRAQPRQHDNNGKQEERRSTQGGGNNHPFVKQQ